MKLLVTGANGQLGRALRELSPDSVFTDSKTLDITNQSAVENFDLSGIEAIINAAAYTAVDQAEVEQDEAWAVNVEGVRNLIALAKRYELPFVQVSTDYVFDGRHEIHPEDEALKPLNVYGQTKAEAETITLTYPKSYIVRTSWVVGDGNNFVRTMLALGKTHPELTVVNDQIGRLTFTHDLAGGIIHLLTGQSEYGIYNLTNEGQAVSWAEIAKEIFSTSHMNVSVKGISTSEYAAGKLPFAPRPQFSTLDLTKIEKTGFEPRDWRQALVEYISNQPGETN